MGPEHRRNVNPSSAPTPPSFCSWMKKLLLNRWDKFGIPADRIPALDSTTKNLLRRVVVVQEMRKMSTYTIATLPRISPSTLSQLLLSQSSNPDAAAAPSSIAIIDVRDDGTCSLAIFLPRAPQAPGRLMKRHRPHRRAHQILDPRAKSYARLQNARAGTQIKGQRHRCVPLRFVPAARAVGRAPIPPRARQVARLVVVEIGRGRRGRDSGGAGRETRMGRRSRRRRGSRGFMS